MALAPFEKLVAIGEEPALLAVHSPQRQRIVFSLMPFVDAVSAYAEQDCDLLNRIRVLNKDRRLDEDA